MDVSAKTIREVEFRERLRGYNPDDVDNFLERVAAGVELLQDRLRQATERAARAEQRAEDSVGGDDALRRTLVLAQRTADLAINEARDEAAAIIEDAKSQAAALMVDVREQAERARIEAEQAVRDEIEELVRARDDLRDDVGALERYLDAERQRIRLALGDAIRWIETAMPELVPAPVTRDPVIPDDTLLDQDPGQPDGPVLITSERPPDEAVIEPTGEPDGEAAIDLDAPNDLDTPTAHTAGIDMRQGGAPSEGSGGAGPVISPLSAQVR